MTRHAPHSDRTEVSSFPRPPAFDPALLDNFRRTSETCAQACLAWQGELFRFMASRFQRDGDTGRALASSKTLDEAAELQREWLQSTVEDYFDEINRLTRLAAKMAPEWMIRPAADASKAADRSEPRHIAEQK